MADPRLAAPSGYEETQTHTRWGLLYPEDTRVRTMFASESAARLAVRRQPGTVLVRCESTVTTATEFSDWQEASS